METLKRNIAKVDKRMKNYSIISRQNNFDIVRLFAALQVVFFHVQNRMEIFLPGVDWLRYLTGVPIFFTVSGFLITSSYLRNRDMKQYAVNRALRIYPAIYMLVLVTTIAALATKDMTPGMLFLEDQRHWFISWVTFDQNFSPPYLSGFGIGTPNGSLWTIPVELTFYATIPLLFLIKRRDVMWMFIVTFYIISIVSNYYLHDFHATRPILSTYSFSLIPYLHYFIVGAVMYMQWDRIRRFIEGKFLWYFVPFMVFVLCSFFFPDFNVHTEMTIKTVQGIMMNILLALCTISAAFTCKNLVKVLKGNDLSYGIYLYHGLVINVIIEMTDNRSPWIYVAVYIISVICAWFSWRYVEKPCLSLKNKILSR